MKPLQNRVAVLKSARMILIERIVVLLILCALAVVAVSRSHLYQAAAQIVVNEANARTLSTVASIIEVQEGSLPTWAETFTSMEPIDAKDLIRHTITYRGTGTFKYEDTSGRVTVERTALAPVPASSGKEPAKNQTTNSITSTHQH